MTELTALHAKITGDATGLVKAADQADASLTKMQGGLVRAGAQSKVYGAQINRASGHTGNIASQFNDIGVMLAAGQSPLLLAVQQGTQLNQVFAQMGSGREVLQGLKAGFLSMVNPVSLATIGIIAGGAALVQWGMSAVQAEEGTDNFKEALDELKESTTSLRDELGLLRSGLDSIEQFKVQERITDLTAQREKLLTQIAGLEKRSDDRAAGVLVAQREKLAVVEAELSSLQEALSENQKATAELEEQKAVYGDVFQLIRDNAGNVMTPMVSDAEAFGIRLAAGASNAFDFIQAKHEEILRGQQVGRGRGSIVEGAGDRARHSAEVQLAQDGPPAPKGNRSEVEAEVDRIRESLSTQIELEQNAHEKRHEVLKEALSRRLLTEQEYHDLIEKENKRHNEAMAGLDVWRHGDQLNKLQSFFQSAATATSQGNEKMLRISKAFAAADALVSTWQGAAKALTLPYPQNIAAYAKVLATGFGAVNAIKGINSGGGGGGAAGGGAAPAGGAAQAEAPQQVSLTLVGESFNRKQILRTVELINDAAGDGLNINVGGR